MSNPRVQLWAEAKARVDAGAVWWLEVGELAEVAAQEPADRFDTDPWVHGTGNRLGTNVPETKQCFQCSRSFSAHTFVNFQAAGYFDNFPKSLGTSSNSGNKPVELMDCGVPTVHCLD